MFKYSKIGLLSLTVSAFALAPAVMVLGTDAAYAKSDNAGGGGKSSGGSNGNSNKSKSSNSNSGKSQTGKTKTDGDDLFLKLFGKKGQNAKKAEQAKKSAIKTTTAPKPKKVVKAFDHPSNLGAMNGALNSSPQAKLAHLKNGNFNGPVGLAAAWALEDYEYRTAMEAYEAAQGTVLANIGDVTTLDLLAGYDPLDPSTYPDTEAALASLESLEEGTVEYEIAYATANFTPESAQALFDGLSDETDENADQAAADALRATLATAEAVEEPSSEELDAADTALFALYKGDTELTEEEKQILLGEMNTPTDEEIAQLLAEAEVETTDDTVLPEGTEEPGDEI